jgi:hypothetical protein
MRFDSLHSEYLKEANMGHPILELTSFKNSFRGYQCRPGK